ncbi:MAG: riboflavin synthase [Betaproteobacteria bacterium]
MFTGIITGLGQIISVKDLGATQAHGKELVLQAPKNYLNDVALGDSIAINGACMTVTAFDLNSDQFSIEISAESLNKTHGLTQQRWVNLEKALRANDRLGGHIVSGHVDGTATVSLFEPIGESWTLKIVAPEALGKFLAYKGSVTINGVSLTVNSVRDTAQGTEISINLIAHTLDNTALKSLQVGELINLEIDTVARYVERMLSLSEPAKVRAS